MISYSLNDNEVHIWKYDIPKSPSNFLNANKILSQEEQLRADNFIYVGNKKRYIAVHLFLRNILSKYTGQSSEELEFIPGLNNKPYLKNNLGLFFNLSYRNNYALLGISHNEFIGVDIEKIRSIDNVDSFTSNYFSDEERREINKMKGKNEQLSLLFTFWAMKESVIKALAIGFSKPLTNYNLSAFIDNHCLPTDFDKKNKWYIQQIEIDINYKAAFAIKADIINLKVFKYV